MIALAIVVLLVLMALAASVAFALSAAGMPVFYALDGDDALLSIGETLFRGTAVEIFAALPLFVLLGELLIKTDMAQNALLSIARFFKVSDRSLISSAIVGSGIFAAISGSSVATGASVTRVIWPSMRDIGVSP